MTALCVVLLVWALVSTYCWRHNLNSSREWRLQFMVERGCDTQETREYLKKVKRKWTLPTK